MVLHNAVKEVNSPNRFAKWESNLCLRPVVLDVCARYTARRVFCTQCPNWHSLKHGKDIEDIVSTECAGKLAARSMEWTALDTVGRIQHSGLTTGTADAVDVIVTDKISDLNLQTAELIESATQRLHVNGILMVVLPAHQTWEAIWSGMRVLWNRWYGGDAQIWSQKHFTKVLESYGFTILESVKVGGLAERQQAIVLVTKKTRESVPAARAKSFSMQ